MVDKMHRNWKWRAAVGAGAALASAATLVTMAGVAFVGAWMSCGIDGAVWSEGSPREEICTGDHFGWIALGVLGIAGLAIVASAVAWVVRGHGGRTFAYAIAGGLATAIAIPLTFAAFPAA
jgi:hypothetical protein